MMLDFATGVMLAWLLAAAWMLYRRA
jgi:hypothetical protein